MILRSTKAYLVISGFTIADDTLSCTSTPSASMSNSLLHRDGGTIASAVGSPCDVSASTDSCESTRFYFEQTFPNVDDQFISISAATVSFSDSTATDYRNSTNVTVDRTNGNDPIAIIVSGTGIAEAAFDKNSAAGVEWLPDAELGSSIGLDTVAGNQNNITIDLYALFGEDRITSILLEGALNVEIPGLKVTNADPSATRSFRAQRAGPELNISGSYTTEVCEIEDNPNSPLSQTGLDAVIVDDGQSPTINSFQITEITSNSAKVVWLTSEVASSQVNYGVASISENSSPISTSATTFHEVVLTGLDNYTVYQVQVESIDTVGNGVTSDIIEFITKR